MKKQTRILLFRIVHFVINQVVTRLPFSFIRIFILKHLFSLKIGHHSYVACKVSFICPWKISIGNNCMINSYVLLDGREHINIKNNVDISWHVKVFTLQHDPESAEHKSIGRNVVIESDCWIATSAIILPGIRLGEGCVIAAGAVVTKDTLPFTVYGGVPAKPIKKRNNQLHYTITEPGIRI